MSIYVLPALHGMLIWWFSTGLIIFLDGLPKRTFRWSMAAASVVLCLSLHVLAISANDTSIAGAYLAFTSAVLIWGWLEISFYMGYVTGPRVRHCAAGCEGWRHFGHAIQASLYHEIAVLVLAGAVIGLTWGRPNGFGMATFVVLWWMHQSARLNVFLGVSNVNAEFLPKHLDHLRSFFTCKPMNLLFPVSVTLSTIAAVLLAERALSSGADLFAATGYVLVATMMVLAILEHWVLVTPVCVTRLWNGLWHWSLGPRAQRRPDMPRQQHRPVAGQVTMGGAHEQV